MTRHDTDYAAEPDWQLTADQDREAADWHDRQAFFAWCDLHGLVPNDTTAEVYADQLVGEAEARADSWGDHYGCVHSIGYHANPE